VDTIKMKEVHRKLIEAMNTHDANRVDMIFADNYIVHEGFDDDLTERSYSVSKEMIRGAIGNPLRGIPDKKIELQFQIAENDLVMSYCVSNATHTEIWGGRKPSGKPVRYVNTFISKLNEDYKIIEHWVYFDAFGAFMQSGVI